MLKEKDCKGDGIGVTWFDLCPRAEDDYILQELEHLAKEIAPCEAEIKQDLKQAQEMKDGWFLREVIKVFRIPYLVELKAKYARLKRCLPRPKSSKTGWVDQERIQRAKEYPILDIAERHLPNLKRSGATYIHNCPFHEERTPSFRLYPHDNHFHCFGCSDHGDVIALTQKLLSLSFLEAVRYLTPQYE